MTTEPNLSRREFLKVSAATGVGLVIGVYLPGCTSTPTATPEPTGTLEPTATPEPTGMLEPTATPEASAWFEPNLVVRIDNDGTVTVTVHRSEMGQGVRTALAMILAEELEADWSTIRVEQAPGDSAYGDQVTGGSRSIDRSYEYLRRAGATAREMLIGAAAETWGVETESCYAENGEVMHRPSGRRLPYGELVETAATMPVPQSWDVTLKDPEDFRIIGTPLGQIDDAQFVDGSAIYGSDVRFPGMLYATVARPPAFAARLVGFDPAPAAAVEGVRHVVEVDGAVAVVAENTWAAIQGRKALEITWDDGENTDLSSADIRQTLAEQVQSAGDDELDAVYDVPFLAHATMEPMNCTADVRRDRCTVWAPTQDPQAAQRSAVSITRLPTDAVTVNVTLMGGGFGRRLNEDYVAEAVSISKAIGAPVQVVWTREDDIQHDFYHPLSVNHARGRLDEPGRPTISSHEAQGAVPTGPWRAVTNVPEAFARECFLDEMAAAIGRDPYELRLESLPERRQAVLKLAADMAGWGTPLPEGWGRGIAFHSTWGATPVAQVAEVSVTQDGTVRVHRVVCAIDCGTVINPDMVEAQMEGGIVFGLTAVLKEGITIENGRVQQSNFHDYPLLRIDEMPTIEVHIVPSDGPPSGVGEMGNPPVIPAVLNAVFAATGKRIRRLPIRAEDLREA